jgi:hypothetical protein
MSGVANPKITGQHFALGRFTYQFFGSAEKLYRDWVDPDSPYYNSRYCQRGYVTAVHAQKQNDGYVLKAKPIVSSIEEGDWKFANTVYELNDLSLIVPSHQPDGVGLRVFYPELNDRRYGDWQLTSSLGQAVQCTSFGNLSGANSYYINHEDYGYDYAWDFFRRSRNGKSSAPYSDFYRQGAIQAIVHPDYGTRYFIIAHDVNQNFYAYPLKTYGAIVPEPGWFDDIKTNVPNDVVRMAQVPWPDGVNLLVAGRSAGVPMPSDYLDRIKSLWMFHPNGQKAVTIVTHRGEPWANDSFTSSKYRDGVLDTELQEDYPILVEINLQITVTGENDGDFTFAMTLGEVIDSRTDSRNPLATAYALVDMGSVQQGDLLVLEYENRVSNFVKGEYIQRPIEATIAKVKARQAEWVSVREWLAIYAAFPSAPDDDDQFSPKLDDFAELANYGTVSEITNHHFFYSTQVNSMDLGSLSFSLSPMMWVNGYVTFVGQGSSVTTGANAASIRVYCFNELVEQTAVGHPTLQTRLNELFDLQLDWWETFTVVHANETLSFTETVDEGEVFGDDGVLSAFGNDWTIRQGGSYPYRVNQTSSFNQVPLFPENSIIYQPTIFKFFDSFPVVRPGFQSSDAYNTIATPETGDFTDYPFGVILLNKAYLTTLNAHDNPLYRFAVHPNGSYAYFYGPIMARNSFFVEDQAPFDDLAQTRVDKIVFRERKNGQVTTLAESTHVDCLNQAFGKSLTSSSYDYTIESNVVNSLSIKFKPNTKDIGEYDWYSMNTIPPIGVNWSQQFLISGWHYIYPIMPASFVGDVRYSTWSPFGVFPNPKIEGLWGFA